VSGPTESVRDDLYKSEGWAGIPGVEGWAGIPGVEGWAGVPGVEGWAGVPGVEVLPA